MRRNAIDLNCDLGEGFGVYQLGDDAEALTLISSANVACGFHAGDPHVMRRTVAQAVSQGVRIGAHPGLPDLLGFGRRRVAATAEEVRDFFLYQIGALKAFVETAGARLQHVKPHGAVFEMALASPAIAAAMCEAARAVDRDLIWLSPAGTMAGAARQAGLRAMDELYADRAYHPDRTLVSRKTPGAVIEDVSLVRARLIQWFDTGTVTTIEGGPLALECDSICVHGDTPGAVEIIRLVRAVCAEKGVAVKPLADLA